MSGQRTKRSKDPDATFVPAVHPAVTLPEEPAPKPAARTIIHCRDCLWGTDLSIGQRRCRGTPPYPYYRQVTGFNGDIQASPMWPVVRDTDWCAKGEMKPAESV